jgi:hypothetical protein
MTTIDAPARPSRSPRVDRTARRDRAGAVLLYVCAAGAAVSALAAGAVVGDAEPAAQGAEAWRMIGFVLFAAVFVLLARGPRQLRGLWEVTIAAKAALPLAGLTVARGADDAATFVVVDGLLVVVLAVAYVLTTGWAAAPPQRTPIAGRPAGPVRDGRPHHRL